MCKSPLSAKKIKNFLPSQRIIRIKTLFKELYSFQKMLPNRNSTLLLWIQLSILLHWAVKSNAQKLGGAKIKTSVIV